MFGILPDSDFLTVFYGIIDLQTLELVYTNAGHPKPMLFRSRNEEIEELGVGGPLVGALMGMDYEEDKIQLNSGDRILIFTDGVTEASPAIEQEGADEFYGIERLKEKFLVNSKLESKDLLKVVMDDLVAYHGSQSFDDDITIFLASIV
jgi:sigma-B regulation protein RsbU (phosphoserine phosphatase)